jgi:hypothetical protein
MKSLFNPIDRTRIIERLDRLTPGHEAKWGSFSADEMVCHVAEALRISLASDCPREPRGPLTLWPLNLFVIYLAPLPKGKAKAPREFLEKSPADWDEDCATLRQTIDEFGQRSADDAWPKSLVFGRISGRAWGVLQYRHCDHHLRQFGV